MYQKFSFINGFILYVKGTVLLIFLFECNILLILNLSDVYCG